MHVVYIPTCRPSSLRGSVWRIIKTISIAYSLHLVLFSLSMRKAVWYSNLHGAGRHSGTAVCTRGPVVKQQDLFADCAGSLVALNKGLSVRAWETLIWWTHCFTHVWTSLRALFWVGCVSCSTRKSTGSSPGIWSLSLSISRCVRDPNRNFSNEKAGLAVTRQIYIRNVLASNTGQDWNVSWISSVPSGTCQGNTSIRPRRLLTRSLSSDANRVLILTELLNNRPKSILTKQRSLSCPCLYFVTENAGRISTKFSIPSVHWMLNEFNFYSYLSNINLPLHKKRIHDPPPFTKH
jgi:hypothetical protein